MARVKPRTKNGPPEMCAAIRRVREASGLTQQAFAQKLGTGLMTLSKWETGKHKPRSPQVFRLLWGLAGKAGLAEEQVLFEQHMGPLPPFPQGVEDKSLDHRIFEELGIDAAPIMRLLSIAEWHQMYAMRIASAYLPEVSNAVMDALRPALDLLKQIIQEEVPADGKLNIAFCNLLALRLDELAARKVFAHKFPGETKR
jgi:transcriptional regulator with XRE-family HTH domain